MSSKIVREIKIELDKHEKELEESEKREKSITERFNESLRKLSLLL